jgi:uncharacterized protein YgfB (UPF0149 family)
MPYGALNSPSDLHGLLCGKLCGGARLDHDAWLQEAWEFLDLTDTPDVQAQDEVALLLDATMEQLNSGLYDMQLLLPENDTDLDQRTQALSEWCHGFLSGFGSAGIDPKQEFSTDAADALRDMAAIVQAAVCDDEDEEEQEKDYSDLIEYVRMAAMHFYAEHHIDEDDITVH